MREELLDYGLTEKEVELYLAALRLGDATASALSNETDLARSTVYDVAASLENQGLMATYQEENKKHFSPKHPETLITALDEKERMIQEVLPELEELAAQTPERPAISVYRGAVGLRQAANKMLDTDEILVYGGGSKADETFGSYTANFAQKRVEHDVQLNAIVGPDIPEHMLDATVANVTEIRTLDCFEDHQTNYFIHGDTVLIWHYEQELIALEITSSALAGSQKQLFAFLWKAAARINDTQSPQH